MKNFVITVARGFGSGGRAIAAKLADEHNEYETHCEEKEYPAYNCFNFTGFHDFSSY